MRLPPLRAPPPCGARALALAAAVMVAPPHRSFEPDIDWATGVWTLPLPEGGEWKRMMPLSALEVAAGLPRLPSGGVLRLEEMGVSDKGGFGGTVWRAAGALCRWQLASVETIRGARILELGAGTGASGLFAAGLGARQVVLTDGEDNLLPLLQKNAKHNEELCLGDVVVGQWCFGELPRFPLPEGLEGANNYFELVIGSDITYSVKYNRNGLAQTLQQLLQSGTAKRCILSHEHRRSDMFDMETIARNTLPSTWDENDDALGIFLASAAEHNLLVTPLVTEWGMRAKGTNRIALTTDLSIFEVTYIG
ncbi:hypothetical protein AB1Y20_019647 [Prymnesium parvum]|uniref:Calmodulin-lysine N-methyltransferase n=1 Tax=Prymnesium parvum TaxID=97485 RepID=A0AB34JSX0_PRYPA